MPTAQELAAASAAWLAANRPDMVNSNNTAAQAAAINAQWRNNTLPVLPVMGNPPPGANETTRVYIGGDANTQGQARDLTQAEYFQMFGRTPEQSEQQKHSYAFDPIDYGAMAGMTLSQIASRYGTGTADRVQDYYAAHPTAQAQAINNQYAAMHSGQYTVGSGGILDRSTFVPTVATAGPATGRAGAQNKLWTPLQTSKYGQESLVERIDVVPTNRKGSGMMAGSVLRGEGGFDWYGSFGSDRTQTMIEKQKIIYDPVGGSFNSYGTPKSIYEGVGFKRIYGVMEAGGSTGSMQSGMFSMTPLSPIIFRRNGEKTEISKQQNDILENPQNYSRVGAEAYYGFVKPLDGRTLGNKGMAQYPASTGNFAELVDPFGTNRPKSEFASTPWRFGVWGSAPAWQTVNTKGELAPSKDPFGVVSGGSPISAAAASLTQPKPFISTSSPAMKAPFISTSSAQQTAMAGSPMGILGRGVGLLTELYGFGVTSANTIRANSPEGKTTDTTPTVAPAFAPYVSGAQNTATNMLSGIPAAASGWFGGAVEVTRKTAAWTPAGAMLVGTAQERTAANARGETFNRYADVLGVGMIGGSIEGQGGKALSESAKKALRAAETLKFDANNIWAVEKTANYVNPGMRVKSMQDAADALFTKAAGKLKSGVNIQDATMTKNFVPSDIEKMSRPSLGIQADKSYRPDWLGEMYKKPTDITGTALETAKKTKKGGDDIIKGVLGAAGGWWASQQPAIQDAWNKTPATLKGGVALVGSTAFAGEAGFGGLATSELGFSGMSAAVSSNPVGWGIGLGLVGVYGVETQFGGLTKAQKFGGDAGQFVYRSGYGFAGGMKQGAQNMYNNSFLLRDRMDTAVKGAGVSMMSIGQGVYRGAETGFGRWNGNEAGTGTRVNKGELGIGGVFRGNEMGTGRFTGTESGTGLWRPTANNYANRPANANKNAFVDALGNSYPTRNPNDNPTRNPFGLPFGTGMPTGNPGQTRFPDPFKSFWTPNKNPNNTKLPDPFKSTYTNPTGNDFPNDNPNNYRFDNPDETPDGPKIPKTKIPDIPLISMPPFGSGSESRGGGGFRSSSGHREIIPISSSLLGFFDAPRPKPRRAPRKVKQMLVTLAPRRAAPRRAVPQKRKRSKR